MSRSAIARNIQDLISLGWVTKISRGSNKTNRANRYQVHEAPEGHSAASDTKHSTASDTKHSTASDTKHSAASDTLTENITNQSIDQSLGGLNVVAVDIDFDEVVIVDTSTEPPIGDRKGVVADDDYVVKNEWDF